MSYKANGDFENIKETFKNDIIEHWQVDNLLYTANGNVGIGTNNPEKKLDVNGDIRVKKLCFVNDENDERCIDYNSTLLMSEMLKSVLPDQNKDMTRLNSMSSQEILDMVKSLSTEYS